MKYTILIVDDEQDYLDLLQFTLMRAGFDVVTAQNGAQALNIVEYNRPHLVILDLMMPEIIGYGVCEILRKSQVGRDIPILIISACSNEDVRRVGLECGANDFLSKTISSRDLIRKINHLLHLDGLAA
ncbi:MAG: histidine kinase [Verrucomicrobiales bacterium]|nr:histidine kinase [Verrucomicrobiales bacterium]